MAQYDDPEDSRTILSHGSTLPAEHGVRSTAHRVLAGRLDWARQLMGKIDLAHVKARNVAPDVVQLLLQHKDPEINRKVARHWPELRAQSSVEKQREIDRIKELLSGQGGKGDPLAGKVHFEQRCASCHKLFGQGGSTAPDLTGYERKNLDFWLPGIINPSLEIREGYANYVLKTKDGRILVGVILEQSPQAVTLRDAANQKITLPRSSIDSLEATPVSLMPPGLLGGLDKDQLRDLFAYEQRETGLKVLESTRFPLGEKGISVRMKGFLPLFLQSNQFPVDLTDQQIVVLLEGGEHSFIQFFPALFQFLELVFLLKVFLVLLPGRHETGMVVLPEGPNFIFKAFQVILFTGNQLERFLQFIPRQAGRQKPFLKLGDFLPESGFLGPQVCFLAETPPWEQSRSWPAGRSYVPLPQSTEVP